MIRWIGAVSVIVLSMVAGACSSGGSATSPSVAPGPRLASTATLKIEAPRDGQTIRDRTVEARVGLEGGRLVDLTTTDVQPDEGHLHVTLDEELVSMTGELRQTLPDLEPGLHLLTVEFVAADHRPFDPRVIAAVAFKVAP